MSANFKISRGEKANLPTGTNIADGTIYFCTDTGEIYIGVGDKLIQINAFKAHQMFGNKDHGEIFNDYDHNNATGQYSHAEGFSTTASGQVSHAEGYKTKTLADSSHAEGSQTIASGQVSHAEGSQTIASGQVSHAEGFQTEASAFAAHAEGGMTKAIGMGSHSEGNSTIAAGKFQHVEGACNIVDQGLDDNGQPSSSAKGKYIHIAGNGETDDERSNAHTLDWSGNAWFAGDVYVGSTSGTNKDTGSKKLSTEEYVNNKVDQVSTDKMKNTVVMEDNYNAIIRLADSLVNLIPADGKTHIIEFTEETGGGGTTTSELHWAEW